MCYFIRLSLNLTVIFCLAKILLKLSKKLLKPVHVEVCRTLAMYSFIDVHGLWSKGRDRINLKSVLGGGVCLPKKYVIFSFLFKNNNSYLPTPVVFCFIPCLKNVIFTEKIDVFAEMFNFFKKQQHDVYLKFQKLLTAGVSFSDLK